MEKIKDLDLYWKTQLMLRTKLNASRLLQSSARFNCNLNWDFHFNGYKYERLGTLRAYTSVLRRRAKSAFSLAEWPCICFARKSICNFEEIWQ